MDLNKLFEEAGKISSFNKMRPYFLLLVVISVVLVFLKILNSKKISKTFYNVELSGNVNKIIHKPKNTYFLIGSEWYLIKDECITNIAKDDSIFKKKDSYILKVYKDQSILKWEGEVKNLIFKKLSIPGD